MRFALPAQNIAKTHANRCTCIKIKFIIFISSRRAIELFLHIFFRLNSMKCMKHMQSAVFVSKLKALC